MINDIKKIEKIHRETCDDKLKKASALTGKETPEELKNIKGRQKEFVCDKILKK